MGNFRNTIYFLLIVLFGLFCLKNMKNFHQRFWILYRMNLTKKIDKEIPDTYNRITLQNSLPDAGKK